MDGFVETDILHFSGFTDEKKVQKISIYFENQSFVSL